MRKYILFLSVIQAVHGQADVEKTRMIHVLTAGQPSMIYFEGGREVEPPSRDKPPMSLVVRSEGQKVGDQKAQRNIGISVNSTNSFVHKGSERLSLVFGKMLKNQPVTNTLQVSTEGMRLPLLIVSPEAKTMNWDRLEVHAVDLAGLGGGERKVLAWNLSKMPVFASFESEQIALAPGERKVVVVKGASTDMVKYKAAIKARNGSLYVLGNSSYTLHSGSVLVSLFLDVRNQGANAPVDLRFYTMDTKQGVPVEPAAAPVAPVAP